MFRKCIKLIAALCPFLFKATPCSSKSTVSSGVFGETLSRSTASVNPSLRNSSLRAASALPITVSSKIPSIRSRSVSKSRERSGSPCLSSKLDDSVSVFGVTRTRLVTPTVSLTILFRRSKSSSQKSFFSRLCLAINSRFVAPTTNRTRRLESMNMPPVGRMAQGEAVSRDFPRIGSYRQRHLYERSCKPVLEEGAFHQEC